MCFAGLLLACCCAAAVLKYHVLPGYALYSDDIDDKQVCAALTVGVCMGARSTRTHQSTLSSDASCRTARVETVGLGPQPPGFEPCRPPYTVQQTGRRLCRPSNHAMCVTTTWIPSAVLLPH